uniref:Nucleotid_trans domain-containing protein n=1 Tax=Caenorhabditis tropicalis TaxID=1561998 RepID=A0A1I7T3R7_9PELO
MGRLKLAFRNVLVPLFFVYFFLHIGFTTWKLFQVDSSRIGYENLRDGPLLAKGGKHVKKGNVIEAIGYGKLSAMGFGNKMRKKPKQVHPVLRPKDEGVPELSEKVKTTVIEESQNLLNKTSVSSNFIYIAMINNAYERMTLNWICNTALMENVHNRTLIISMDSSTCHSIKTQWDETIKCVSLDIDNYKIGYDWGRQQYINILTLRANIMELLTSNDIPHVLIETDATWFKVIDEKKKLIFKPLYLAHDKS